MQTPGISDPVLVYLSYTVSGEDRPDLIIRYPHSKRLTDILLSDVTYNDDILMELIVLNVTAFSDISLLIIRKCNNVQ